MVHRTVSGAPGCLGRRGRSREFADKLKDQKAESVVDALDRLERKWGDMFSKVFRSITVDNGVEFSDCKLSLIHI